MPVIRINKKQLTEMVHKMLKEDMGAGATMSGEMREFQDTFRGCDVEPFKGDGSTFGFTFTCGDAETAANAKTWLRSKGWNILSGATSIMATKNY